MTNLGARLLDIVDWTLGLGSLKSVYSAGGRYCLKDNGETPDIQDALFEFDGWTAAWSLRECSRGERRPLSLEFFRTQGSLRISRSSFVVTPDPDLPPGTFIPQFDVHPVGGPALVKPAPLTLPSPPAGGEGRVRGRTEAIVDKSGDGRAQFLAHVRNFLDCIKS